MTKSVKATITWKHNLINKLLQRDIWIITSILIFITETFKQQQKHQQTPTNMTSPAIKSNEKAHKAKRHTSISSSNPNLMGVSEISTNGCLSWIRVFTLARMMLQQGC